MQPRPLPVAIAAGAEQICRCSRGAAVFRVVLPMLKPGVFAGFFYAFIVSFGDVPVAIFLTDHTTTSLPVAIFQSLQLVVPSGRR